MDWSPVSGHVMTRWAEDVTPDKVWQEYPRPQMTRPQWLNLNGVWEYGIAPRGQIKPPQFTGEILVPYPIESALSGVKKPLLPNQRLWYRRTFNLPEDWFGKHIILHFDAVDWETNVWINGSPLNPHKGGYLPFKYDITPYINYEKNELVVAVWDPTDTHWQQRGKQSLKPKWIWYTANSGIWQTVWLEPVPNVHITGLKLTPDIDTSTLRVEVNASGATNSLCGINVEIRDGEGLVAAGQTSDEKLDLIVPLPNPKLWSPDSPHLYDLTVEICDNAGPLDRVGSYFGMRKFSLGRDGEGRPRLCLNNQPLFQYGPLDQGYWPEGLYTPPSDKAMLCDLELVKMLGCNMVRKHVKVEPARYYYHCDQLGLIVWQDMINGAKAVGNIKSFLTILFGSKRRDDKNLRTSGRHVYDSRYDYMRELREVVEHLYNFTCIGMWVPFNEGWGQFDARATAEWLKLYDPTRPIDHASGWFDQGGGDCHSLHVYFKSLPKLKPDEKRAAILSEFGGYSLKHEGHLWNCDKNFGYKKFKTSDNLTEAYISLLEKQLMPLIEQGLSGAVYTQLADVEIETNGFVSYDRAIMKMDVSRVREVHEKLLNT